MIYLQQCKFERQSLFVVAVTEHFHISVYSHVQSLMSHAVPLQYM